MPISLSDNDIQQALDTCASEPVHIPGIIQPFGCLVAMPGDSDAVTHASENTGALLGVPVGDLLGQSLAAHVPSDVSHALRNARFQTPGDATMTTLGDFQVAGRALTAHVSAVRNMTLLEFEPYVSSEFEGVEALKTLSYLMHQIEACTSQSDLFGITTRMFRHLSGFDRVMVYRFDRDFNGEVLAEDRRGALPSFLGLRFPHWDIPPQARDIMARVPLRIIANVDQVPVVLRAADASVLPLDISQSATRGVSKVHLEYLRNMDIKASMTLTVKLEDRLWGMISFHHRRPRVLAPALRDILFNVGRLFSAKLLVLEQRDQMDMVARVDSLKDRVLDTLQDPQQPQAAAESFRAFAERIGEIMDASGLYMVDDGVERQWGQVPDPAAIATLRTAAASGTDLRAFENLSAAFPGSDNALNGCAGAIVLSADRDRAAMIFREEVAGTLKWAGNPDKTIEDHEGRRRLSPRGSFSTFLEETRGASQVWTDQDLHFARRIWAMLDTADRNALKESLNRQQKLLIGELNHRVRNILALVRSVSQQAQSTSHGSLDSYSQSLEARIDALAASHDIASGSITSVIPIWELIDREFAPYLDLPSERLIKEGPQSHIRPDIAPMFSLVVHELVTNAVKHGAISTANGSVWIRIEQAAQGLSLHWKERGGPPVAEPDRLGFGASLIREAIPFELDGRASLTFAPDGVSATLFLPQSALKPSGGPTGVADDPETADLTSGTETDERLCLVVEDSYVIAASLRDQMKAQGFGSVETTGTIAGAMEVLKHRRPDLAILDVNLRGTETSVMLARTLQAAHVPFFFLTGYGEDASLPDEMSGVPKVTKPASKSDLIRAIVEVEHVTARR